MTSIDTIDPAGIAKRNVEHEQLIRLQAARAEARFGSVAYRALEVAIDVHIGATSICLPAAMARLNEKLKP